ncbi:phosphatidylinositol alpha-mannosyltransferase [Candidatus Planktophila dulcis]|uniref:Phosphatidylinositol alpha-mannosyltransferase n=1 Tax=Candidatus Planktophila dulcis TaxID=1884914 RepID=A0AAC9YT71_9ACTN|nr:glycosyltransferase family 4 protein [Candidatus Planktophila dulcis]ASY12076.1 phosphatidylinositol alpha-mannosyltransferase [Candidatus Planktophila dulcis]
MPLSKKRIGIVCPYGWDTPGGVQSHVGDLAQYLIRQGHYVSVLAPAIDEDNLPDFVTSAGRPIAIPYNGAVARVLFGPIAFSRVRQWIANGNFDVLHLHEPAIPSISLLACWAAEGPMVGTFHAAAKRQKVTFAVAPILEPVIEKLTARIAVSEAARETLTEHLETDAIVVPNGIYADLYRDGVIDQRWTGNTLGFIGRFEEKRKGLDVLVAALPSIIAKFPDLKVFVAGPGDAQEVLKEIDPYLHSRFEFLGRISESEKANFLASVGLYIAPNTGGESFGIILAEALAGGASVVASDIPAFDSLLGHGAYGTLFASEDSQDLAKKVIDLLGDEESRRAIAQRGKKYAQEFDWDVVAEKIYDVYEMAMVGGSRVTLSSENRAWNKFLGRQS